MNVMALRQGTEEVLPQEQTRGGLSPHRYAGMTPKDFACTACPAFVRGERDWWP